MKLSKKKVIALALAVCMIAILSFSSLAWFTDSDSAKNEFMIAGSEDENPDEIFSVDVWEDKDNDGVPDDEVAGDDEGLIYEDILPGDVWDKDVYVENTGAYEQYIRVKITVSDAHVWQDIYQANMVPVTEFVDVNVEGNVYGISSYQDGDNFVYDLYYAAPLAVGSKFVVFEHVFIPEHMTQEQAAPFAGGFQISVEADAVQTKNVGNNVYEAFQTVGMVENPINTEYVKRFDQLKAAIENDVQYIVLEDDIKFLNASYKIEGNSAELYLNNYQLTTAPGNNPYSIKMNGDLTVNGFGTLTVRTSHMQVCGTLVIKGATVAGQGHIYDASNNVIDLT